MFFVAGRNIPDHGLRPFVHMDVLDADELRATLAQPPQSLDLRHIRPHQSRVERGQPDRRALPPTPESHRS